MRNVLDFSADPTGASPSDAAFAAAIAAAAAEGNHLNRWGDTVIVPAGTYRLDHDLDVYGAVILQGTGIGGELAGTRLNMGQGSIIILHSQASGPVYAPAGAKLVGFDVRAQRPTFVPWAPFTPFSLGQCVRIPGDNRAYYECVRPGTSGGSAPTQYGAPELSRVWTRRTTVGYHAVRRSTDGDLSRYYVSEGAGPTGESEPHWDTTADGITLDGSVKWRTQSSAGYYWTDGTCLWRTQYHTGVLVQTGQVEACTFYGFANFGVTIMAAIGYVPYSNANGWRVRDCSIGSCGGGVYVHGPDANGGICEGVMAVTIGYEANDTEPIPYPGSTDTPRVKKNSGGIGFWDDSFLGNTWIACIAETCEGRGYYAPQLNAWSVFIGCYTEQNCAPNFFSQLCAVVGGIQAAGFERYGSGLFLGPGGIDGLRVQMDNLHPDGPTGFLSNRDMPGIYQFTDSQQGGQYFAWAKGYPDRASKVWTMGLYPTLPRPMFGVQGWDDVDEGAGWRDFYGHFRGVPGDDNFVCYAPSWLLAVNPELMRRGKRRVGDRFEPPGGYIVGSSRYIGKICTTAGWDGGPWGPGVDYKDAPEGAASPPANVIVPPDPYANGHAYKCIRRGLSGAEPPRVWPTIIGDEFDDSGVRWRCVGPTATYEYYGQFARTGG